MGLDIPKSWVKTALKNVTEIKMGQSPKGAYVYKNSSGIPLIGGASNIQNGSIITDKSTTRPTKICKAGDLIYCVRATIGRLGIANKEYCLGRGVAGIRSNLNWKYLKYYLENITQKITEKATGSTFLQIDKSTLESTSVSIPALKEQNRIVQKIESYFEIANNIEKSINEKRQFLQKAKNSILQQAFQGKLVPQIESEGTGHALLQRILEAKSSEEEKKEKKATKQKKSTFSKSKVTRSKPSKKKRGSK